MDGEITPNGHEALIDTIRRAMGDNGMVGVASSFYLLARTLFARTSAKREKELRDLISRLEEQVSGAVAAKTNQVGASIPRSIAAGEGPPAAG